MDGRSSLLAAAPMLVVLTGMALARPPQGPPGRVDHPNLRAALHELRDARQELRDSREAWPPGHQERAMQALEDAVDSLKTIWMNMPKFTRTTSPACNSAVLDRNSPNASTVGRQECAPRRAEMLKLNSGSSTFETPPPPVTKDGRRGRWGMGDPAMTDFRAIALSWARRA